MSLNKKSALILLAVLFACFFAGLLGLAKKYRPPPELFESPDVISGRLAYVRGGKISSSCLDNMYFYKSVGAFGGGDSFGTLSGIVSGTIVQVSVVRVRTLQRDDVPLGVQIKSGSTIYFKRTAKECLQDWDRATETALADVLAVLLCIYFIIWRGLI